MNYNNQSNISLEGESLKDDSRPKLCLDICCGTGTIGIVCAKSGNCSTLGVELCKAAVDNAHINAALNGLLVINDAPVESSDSLQNGAAFVCARAEAVLESVLGTRIPRGETAAETAMLTQLHQMAKGKKLLAVVDPPREGLHVDCLRAIRNCTSIERLVYVSCNPTKSLIRDAALLCGPSSKRFTGNAFYPTRATPVDLFPSTPHCEMLVVFERLQ